MCDQYQTISYHMDNRVGSIDTLLVLYQKRVMPHRAWTHAAIKCRIELSRFAEEDSIQIVSIQSKTQTHNATPIKPCRGLVVLSNASVRHPLGLMIREIKSFTYPSLVCTYQITSKSDYLYLSSSVTSIRELSSTRRLVDDVFHHIYD